MTKFDEAILFAVKAHSGAVRKGETAPYILHPLEAAAIAGTMTGDEDVLAAAVLHDTVEDTEATMDEIRTLFGDRVAALVSSETEDKRPQEDRSASWRIRKEETLASLRAAEDPGIRIMWLADKLSNMRSFYRAWKLRGNDLWRSFNQKDPAQQAWYYRAVEEQLNELRDCAAWQEYHFLVETVFEGVE